jgi:tetratricopeptide (TPR) repeat protein
MFRRGAIAIHRPARLSCVHLFLSCLLASLLASTAIAQRGGVPEPQVLPGPDNIHPHIVTTYETTPGTAVVIFTVSAERKGIHLDRQALLRLVNLTNQLEAWQTTEETSRGVFTNVAYGAYAVEVSAVGYLSTRKEVRVTNASGPSFNEIILNRDPDSVNLDVWDEVMTPKARKEAKRAISALKSGRLKEAQKQLDDAFHLSPASPDLNFLLGYLYFQEKDFARAGSYLGTAANLNPHHAQALTLLGRTGLERKDYPAARSALEQAVLADPESWLPHNLLADAYLHQQNYGQARDQAQIAITVGKNTAGPAHLVLGEALLNLGEDQQGIAALNVFLQQAPQHPMAGQVRALIADVEQHPSISGSYFGISDSSSSDSSSSDSPNNDPSKSSADFSGVDPVAALDVPELALKAWQPPGVDDAKPAVAADVICPTEKVIEESGKRVQELVDDVSRFAAVEDLLHQSLDPFGIPVRSETRKYDYVAAISEPQPGFLAINEYRSDKMSLAEFPDHIASTGFAALALVFHPHMRGNFAMTCEGLGDWRGQATWLVHFRQRSDQPNRIHSYKIGNQIYAVDLKGRAWITADKFQIVRIESEMVNPMPEIRLLGEHEIVEYGPVPFPRKNTSLWLPKSADIYFDFRKHHYYRRHSFDNFMLYSVDSDEKRKEPVAKPQGKDGKQKEVEVEIKDQS